MLDRFSKNKARDRALAPFEQQAPTLGAELGKALTKEEKEARAQLTQLQDELAEAALERDAASALLKLAEQNYERAKAAGGEAGSPVIQALQRRRNDHDVALERVAAVERSIEKTEAVLQQEDGKADLQRKRARVAEVWAPPLVKLLPAVRSLLPLLREQHAAFVTLDIEHIYGLLPGGGDYPSKLDIAGTLNRWIVDAEKALGEMERWTGTTGKSEKADK